MTNRTTSETKAKHALEDGRHFEEILIDYLRYRTTFDWIALRKLSKNMLCFVHSNVKSKWYPLEQPTIIDG